MSRCVGSEDDMCVLVQKIRASLTVSVCVCVCVCVCVRVCACSCELAECFQGG